MVILDDLVLRNKVWEIWESTARGRGHWDQPVVGATIGKGTEAHKAAKEWVRRDLCKPMKHPAQKGIEEAARKAVELNEGTLKFLSEREGWERIWLSDGPMICRNDLKAAAAKLEEAAGARAKVIREIMRRVKNERS